LTRGFTHKVTMRDGSTRSVQLYPGSGTYAPLDQISPHMVSAVLTTEDGGFWRHRGFLPSQFAEALRRNVRAGEVEIGASTITMQMVKNVFLTHERTLARKLQEMFLTWYVEQALGKQRIMEIYLNVIEFGPGVYGVTRAAEHYFGRTPRELSSLESAYLAAMLPSPVRRHVHYCRDQLSPRMQVKLRRIHGLMFSRKRIDELEYQQWKDADLVFDARERGDEASCLAHIDRLLQASGGQKALTGLLTDEDEDVDEPWLEFEPPALPSVDDEPGDARDAVAPEPPGSEPDPANPDLERLPAMDRGEEVEE
jgi:membrane peptidoglycan carboxypeptidase